MSGAQGGVQSQTKLRPELQNVADFTLSASLATSLQRSTWFIGLNKVLRGRRQKKKRVPQWGTMRKFKVAEKLILHVSFLCAAEIQRGVREVQSPDQHGPWGPWDPCCQGGLQEHHERKCPERQNQKTQCQFDSFLTLLCHFLSPAGYSSTTRRSTRPPRTSGSGLRTDPTSSTLPRIPCNRVMWDSRGGTKSACRSLLTTFSYQSMFWCVGFLNGKTLGTLCWMQ